MYENKNLLRTKKQIKIERSLLLKNRTIFACEDNYTFIVLYLIANQLKIIDMANFGWQEILLIAVVILILFGARKIPEFMRGLGKGVREFNEAKGDARKEEDKEEQNKTVSDNKKTEQISKD